MKRLLFFIFIFVFTGAVYGATKTITWVNGNSVHDTTTCTIGGDLNLPSTTPTKSGYNFVGWEAYTKLQYIQNAANTYVNTGIIPESDDIEMEILFDAVTGSNYLFQSRVTSSSNTSGISGSQSGNKIHVAYNGSTSVISSITRTAGNQYLVRATLKNGASTLYVKDMTNNIEDTKTGSYTFAVLTVPFCLFGNTGGNRLGAGAHIYYAKMKVNDEYVMNYVPVKRKSDNAVGFLDLATGSFKTADAGSLIAGPNAQ